MSQLPVTAYFNTRKRQACDEPNIKSKVLLLAREDLNDPTSTTKQNLEFDECDTVGPKVIVRDAIYSAKEDARINKAVRNIQFDSPKTSAEKASKTSKARTLRSRRLFSTDEQQTDIRDIIQKMGNDDVEKKVPFEKKSNLSPKKLMTPKKDNESELLVAGSHISTRRNTAMKKLTNDNMDLEEIKNKINKSSRLMELKASIERFKNADKKLKQLEKQNDIKKPQMQKFEKIEVEIPVSPQKMVKSPTKALMTPTKNKDLSKTASPQRKLLFEPKETTPSPVKSSPTKAYQKYLSLAENKTPALPLPFEYRFLAEVFRSVDTVSAMLFNRKELITFNKLKPAVQELLRHDFKQDHLAQIKAIYPEAYTYRQEKHRNFGSVTKTEKYELVLVPTVCTNNGKNTPDADNVLKTASESSMGPTILLERRRKFYDILLERVKDEHEKFLQNLETPLIAPKEKIMRWHPDFDVEICKEIEKGELPQPPQIEKTTAKEVLDKAKSLFNCGTRMEKALQKLVESNMTSKSKSPSTEDSVTQTTEDNVQKVNSTIVDTPPTTPTTKDMYLAKTFKGIPKALLEKVRAKQAAKALEAMTRTPNADKEATFYSRLPEIAKILRNIFVTEKKGVLSLEIAIQRLDNSFRTKLTPQEIEEHIRLLCKQLPMWINIQNVRKIDYLKLNRDFDIGKVVKRLEILANDKVKI